jgi:hypothetical protein
LQVYNCIKATSIFAELFSLDLDFLWDLDNVGATSFELQV